MIFLRLDMPVRESGYGSRKCQIRAYEEISSGSNRLARLWAARIAVRAGIMWSSKLMNVVVEGEEEVEEEGGGGGGEEEGEEEVEEGLGRV